LPLAESPEFEKAIRSKLIAKRVNQTRTMDFGDCASLDATLQDAIKLFGARGQQDLVRALL
jgi:hypothetical protein